MKKLDDKIKAKDEEYKKELQDRDRRKENRDAEKMELRERIDELNTLEAEIDEDLLELEDVKTKLKRVQHEEGAERAEIDQKSGSLERKASRSELIKPQRIADALD